MKQELFRDLTYGLVSVTFRTNSGGTRVMRCTRDLENVPENLRSGINDWRLMGPSIVAAWDLDNNAWRAFRWDSVISYEIYNADH